MVEVKLSLFADEMISYIENLKESNKTLLQLINSVMLQDRKSILKKQLHFFNIFIGV